MTHIYKAIAAIIIFFTAACSHEQQLLTDSYIPSPPDYSDPQMWIIHRNAPTDVSDSRSVSGWADSGADVFYIPSTWEFDWTTPDGRVCHYADPSLLQHRLDMGTEMEGVAGYMADGNNFFSPFYRHITLDTWATLDEQLIDSRYQAVSFVDVKNAFDHFIANFNDGRPFILAGFSQGGKSVVELMKTLTPGQRERMIAAYVMGYKVTPADTIAAPWIKGATGDDDTGVTICYNSVSAPQYTKPVVARPNVMTINPVNWRTDATPATLDDTITVTLDTRLNVLVVKGFDGSYLPNILDILNTGDYHGAEPWLYSECLRDNIHRRTRSFSTSYPYTPYRDRKVKN